MITQELHQKIEQAVRAKAGEKFDLIELTKPRGVYIVPVPSEIEDLKYSCTLEIDGRKYDIYKPGTMINRSIHREIEAAVRAKAGKEFVVLSLKEPHGIDVVPIPKELAKFAWSCTMKIDGRHYYVYFG